MFIEPEDQKVAKFGSEGHITNSYAAGICLYDLIHSVDWLQRFFMTNKECFPEICKKLIEVETEDYAARNL